ncbi:DUF255 domain-containing protein [Ancylomarina euxinus]|uniref:DUF255 domain-containing protein n=1 Tax=Ancylomarina euxinus TaxID=2283627 RepID=A0A425XZ59_9BACT|nr:thioredoxin domain-containing protein [Ancylomarina euxinus]MCZ4695584.1 thioredoxin domain-containing protein [Ancylomarina euxinus]MUP15965.1 thioredoxin fold domain-containing protein [Ancylomarina euxinus]RRG20407.1 DUF255 domain-containing protein [Ancylomarina euxinus]
MKKIIISLTLIICTCSAFSQGIKFEKCSFKEALVLANENNKFLFIDCYTQWCGPCKVMAKNIFTQKKVGDYFNNNVISLKIDCGSVEGEKFAADNNITSYPTMLIYDADGKLLKRIEGAAPDADILISYVKQAVEPDENFNHLLEKYNKGDRNLELIADLLIDGYQFAYIQEKEERVKLFERLTDIFGWYISVKDIGKWINKKDFKIISIYLSKEEKYINFVLNHYNEYKNIIDEEIFSEFIVKSNNFFIYKYSSKGDLKFRTYIENIKGKFADEYKREPFMYEKTQYITEATYSLKYDKNFKEFYSYISMAIETYKKMNILNANIYTSALSLSYDNIDFLSKSEIKEMIRFGENAIKTYQDDLVLNFTLSRFYELNNNKKKLISAYKKIIPLIKKSERFKTVAPIYEEKLKNLQK